MKKRLSIFLLLVVGIIVLAGCRPYNKPEFVTIEPNQTAFVIPLIGETGEQGQFQSEEFLRENQVATKEIQIAKRWVKTGRLWFSGEWRPTVRVVVIDRFPETREWLSDTTRGTSDKAEGFVGESKDAIKFKVGMSATAQILEEDTSVFLYQYSGKTLEEVMDFEVRNKIGTTLLEKYGSMTIDEIQQGKEEVIEHVREHVVPYFKERGITVSNIGYVGDLEYLQEDVQSAINERFKAEQDMEAQEIRNKTLEEQAKAEAKASKIRQEALETQVEIMKLENEEKWIDKWDGKQPNTLVGGESGIMINIPSNNSNE